MAKAVEEILVLFNFSAACDAALNYALEFNRHLGAQLTVLNVIEPPHITTLQSPAEREAREQALCKAAREKLQAHLGTAETNIQLKVVVAPPVEGILHAVETGPYELVVMGHRGKDRPMDRFLGTTLHALLNNLPQPLLVVATPTQFHVLQRIVFAQELTKLHEAGLQWVCRLAAQFDATIEVVDVEAKATRKAALDVAAKTDEIRKAFGHEQLDIRVLDGEDVDLTLEAYLSTVAPQLFAFTAHHHNFWERILSPTLTYALANDTPVPVLALPD